MNNIDSVMNDLLPLIEIDDYNYILPNERIAKFPLPERDQSKLLVYNSGEVEEDVFTSLPDYIPNNSLMVFNNTKVIQARMRFRKEQTEGKEENGALIEVFLLEPANPNDYSLIFQQTGCCSWFCLVGNLKRWKGETLKKSIVVNNEKVILSAHREQMSGDSHVVEFEWDNNKISFSELLEAVGEIPIPPYLNRESTESDKTSYQTIYSSIKGSVAAPTAGLHFTKNVLTSLDHKGVERDELTLHVGAGTFKPVKSSEISGHAMHTEFIQVNRETIEKLIEHGGKAVAVGTTTVRTLESLYYIGLFFSENSYALCDNIVVEQWTPYITGKELSSTDALKQIIRYLDKNRLDTLYASTRIIIVPGYKFHIVSMMVTNFHQPRSTLLLLVSAFVGGDWKKIYNFALSRGFRFLSYGDSSLLIP